MLTAEWVDLEDARAQRELSARLTALRRVQFDAPEYARQVGVTVNNLHGFEHNNQANMSVRMVERRAAPLGLRLEVELVGLPAEVEDDLEIMILAQYAQELGPAGGLEERALRTARLTAARLQVARVLLNVTQRELAARMGVAPSTVTFLLTSAGGQSRLASFQRIMRGLGGQAVLHLITVGCECCQDAAPAQGRRWLQMSKDEDPVCVDCEHARQHHIAQGKG